MSQDLLDLLEFSLSSALDELADLRTGPYPTDYCVKSIEKHVSTAARAKPNRGPRTRADFRTIDRELRCATHELVMSEGRSQAAGQSIKDALASLRICLGTAGIVATIKIGP